MERIHSKWSCDDNLLEFTAFDTEQKLRILFLRIYVCMYRRPKFDARIGNTILSMQQNYIYFWKKDGVFTADVAKK